MKNLSTGEPSTLGTYKKIAKIFSEKAVDFIQTRINESPNGEDEIVIADERQVLFLLATLSEQDEKEKVK